LIIGGGIVGSGIARDAAMRGLRVGLVEQHDFASGTSSRSSRLLHGGLRYLAQGRIGLVRQASIEKKLLHEIAPHLAEPRAFIFPTYRANRHWVLWHEHGKMNTIIVRHAQAGKDHVHHWTSGFLWWSLEGQKRV
jgi:glycerol-3-phosphate dehydrogenase